VRRLGQNLNHPLRATQQRFFEDDPSPDVPQTLRESGSAPASGLPAVLPAPAPDRDLAQTVPEPALPRCGNSSDSLRYAHAKADPHSEHGWADTIAGVPENPLARCYFATCAFAISKAGTTPNCCINPSASQTTQVSAIFPREIRLMKTPSTLAVLFVAAIPRNSAL